ncbi:unnamed protein product [Fusarium graminearum]|nr:unnamed protein product [Fusarium graminearum]
MDNVGDILLTDTTEWFKNLSFHAEFDTSFLLPLPFIDLSGFSDEILVENPTDLTTMSSESMLPQEKTIFDEAVIAHSSTLGSWKPTHEDYLGAARASLYVPLDEQVLLEEGLGHLNSTVIGGCLSSARRDEIIVAMIDGTQTAQTLLAVRMFPSVEILDRFLKLFLTSQETSALAFIHIPTFDPSTCSLSLLMACIAAGATLSPIASARKFGLGLFDVLRLYLAASAEKQNTLTRDLSYVQSLMILSETGLWSGDKRISEISDFLSELTANMLRHAGRFVQHSYLNPILMLEGPLGELDAVWIRWAQQESLKRSVFRHLLQCTQRSVLKNMPTQMSPFEVSTPIPEDCRFWYAKSAVEWKSLYQGHRSCSAERRMSLADCFSDMQSIDLLPWSQSLKLSILLMIYSFLSILVEDRRRSVLFHKKRDSGWSFVDITQPPGDSHLVFQFNELRNAIERDHATAGSAVLTFMVKFNILYSATPRYLRDSFLTYGKQASGSDVFYKLREWRQSRSSRSAIWHAGQLLRACRMIAPTERTDFHLFGVYHAILCLWTYWTATRKSPLDMTGTSRQTVSWPRVLLDGPESLETQRWINHNDGTPYLTRPPKSDPLCDKNPKLVSVDATESEGTFSKLPLVDILNECFLQKEAGRNIPILQHASLILRSLERL